MTVMKPDYDISELKQITESSNIKADANSNKMHYDELRNVVHAWTIDEATIVANELAKKYPTIMFMGLSSRMDDLNIALDTIWRAADNANS